MTNFEKILIQLIAVYIAFVIDTTKCDDVTRTRYAKMIGNIKVDVN